jgi:uncharacterized protein (TIGR02646 family)
VKYICKTNEPEVLANFKARGNKNWKLTYKKFKKCKSKKELQDLLIIEQGHLCCYCGRHVSQLDSHIEHFKPQFKYPDLDLDYFNMLVSCQNQTEHTEPKHCGFAKYDWFDQELLISPLIADCADFFEYTDIGEILPTRRSEKAAAATETIDKLSLNIPKLQAGREGVINSFYDEPDFLSSLSDSEIDKLIHYYSCIDDEGQHQSYCQVIIYLLKQEKMYRNNKGD